MKMPHCEAHSPPSPCLVILNLKFAFQTIDHAVELVGFGQEYVHAGSTVLGPQTDLMNRKERRKRNREQKRWRDSNK